MATIGPRRKARMTDLFVAISIMATMIGTFRRFWKRFLRHVLPSRRHLPQSHERTILRPTCSNRVPFSRLLFSGV
jgi:hypothetical protein